MIFIRFLSGLFFLAYTIPQIPPQVKQVMKKQKGNFDKNQTDALPEETDQPGDKEVTGNRPVLKADLPCVGCLVPIGDGDTAPALADGAAHRTDWFGTADGSDCQKRLSALLNRHLKGKFESALRILSVDLSGAEGVLPTFMGAEVEAKRKMGAIIPLT